MDIVQLIPGAGLSRAGEEDRFRAEPGPMRALMYGPYEQRDQGRYEVDFSLALAEASAPLGDPVCAVLDIVAKQGASVLARRYLLHSQLTTEPTTVSLMFDLVEPRTLEYRVWTTDKAPLVVSCVARVTRLSDAHRLTGPRTAQEQRWENEREFLDGYLRNVSGLIHVGANLGQERRYYWLIGLDVVWVEPIREIYEQLVDNLALFPRQRAVNALLSRRSGEEVEFQIASNNGASSSILDLQDHAVIFPDVSYVERRRLVTTTLADIVRDHRIPLDRYQALTLDVEGAEQLILEGAADVLDRFAYVKCEVADFPARAGTPTVADLDGILTAAGFVQLGRRAFADGPGNAGTLWDVVWKKLVPGEPLQQPGVPLPLVFDPGEVEGLEKSPTD